MSGDYVAAAERTALAWERTGFGLVGVGALLVHDSREHNGIAQLLLGIAVMGSGTVVSIIVAPGRYRKIMADVRAGRAPLPGRLVHLLGAMVGLVAVTGVVLLRP